MDISKDINSAFERAQEQRHEALRNALATVDAFATPTLSPDQYTAFVEMRDLLIAAYTPVKFSPNQIA